MDVEVRVAARPETCDALAVKLLALDLKDPERVITALYRDQDAIAVLLWKALRKQFPAEDPADRAEASAAALDGQARCDGRRGTRPPRSAASNRKLKREAPTIRPTTKLPTPGLASCWPWRSSFIVMVKSKLTAKYLALIGTGGVSVRTLIDVGNLYAEEKQWSEAAKTYEAAWTKDRRSASALYLLGWTQVKRGEEAEGRKQMELALVVPLGDGESRRDLVRTLVRLHQDDEAARQRQWVLRLAAIHDVSIVQALDETGFAAAEKLDGTNLATVWQRVAAELLLARSGFMIETRYYLHWPFSAHSARAGELLRANKTAEAIDELHQAEAVQPANIQLALDFDAELRKHGAGGEADALYRRMLERHEAFCRDFPHSGTVPQQSRLAGGQPRSRSRQGPGPRPAGGRTRTAGRQYRYVGRSPFPPRQSGRGRATGEALPGDGPGRSALQEAARPLRGEVRGYPEGSRGCLRY